jgi:hypothetical protein
MAKQFNPIVEHTQSTISLGDATTHWGKVPEADQNDNTLHFERVHMKTKPKRIGLLRLFCKLVVMVNASVHLSASFGIGGEWQRR